MRVILNGPANIKANYTSEMYFLTWTRTPTNGKSPMSPLGVMSKTSGAVFHTAVQNGASTSLSVM